jgi:Fic family protein
VCYNNSLKKQKPYLYCNKKKQSKKIMQSSNYIIQPLPLPFDVETKKVLKKAIEAGQYLAELKGVAHTIPNKSILINTLILQEAKDSSAIENIITTHDELFKADVFTEHIQSWETKEVMNYVAALKHGFELVTTKGFLSNNFICEIQAILENNKAGFRTQMGTVIKNTTTGEVLHTPPQDHEAIVQLMKNLEKYINDNDVEDLHPLVKMAIIHFQFESIHPFYDGNGRTGRIVNILYLTLNGLLDLPILYLSRYIIQHKPDYYKLLQTVRNKNDWESWVLFMLDSITQTAEETIQLIHGVNQLMTDYKNRIRQVLPKIYSKDLLETIFKHPYTKIEHLERDLEISYLTARSYLDKLTDTELMQKQKINKTNFYINPALIDLFTQKQKRL